MQGQDRNIILLTSHFPFLKMPTSTLWVQLLYGSQMTSVLPPRSKGHLKWNFYSYLFILLPLFLGKYKLVNGFHHKISTTFAEIGRQRVNRAEACKGEQDKHSVPAAEILLSKLGYLLYCFHPWGFSSWYELPCPVSLQANVWRGNVHRRAA